LKSIEFYDNLTEIAIDNDGFIKFKMVGKKAVYKMDFSIKSDPEWIRDSGSGIITIQNFTSELKLFPMDVKGKIQFNFSDAHIDVESFDAQFKGQTEIIESVQLIIQHFNSFLKTELSSIIGIQLTKSAEISLNDNFVKQS
jgi:hypothetical protein